MNIYVVDDDMSIRRALNRLFKSYGYNVSVYATGTEFLKSLKKESLGCAVLDVRMPEMTGLEIQQYLINHGYQIKVIFITAHDTPTDAQTALENGAIKYLAKPFEENELLEAIESIKDNNVK